MFLTMSKEIGYQLTEDVLGSSMTSSIVFAIFRFVSCSTRLAPAGYVAGIAY